MVDLTSSIFLFHMTSRVCLILAWTAQFMPLLNLLSSEYIDVVQEAVRCYFPLQQICWIRGFSYTLLVTEKNQVGNWEHDNAITKLIPCSFFKKCNYFCSVSQFVLCTIIIICLFYIIYIRLKSTVCAIKVLFQLIKIESFILKPVENVIQLVNSIQL